jgi:hypothetical protein
MNLEIKLPTPTTLKKYGLSAEEYCQIYTEQGGLCPICQNPLDKRTNIDHFHIKGWKRMPAEQKKKYVRGILCWTCNRLIVGRGVNLIRLRAATLYLERFEEKINHDSSQGKMQVLPVGKAKNKARRKQSKA